jgi:plasmid stabilization system protein ParE
MNKSDSVRYLPLFVEDLQAAYDYIAVTLGNPEAALHLMEETDRAIQVRMAAPKAYEPYRSNRERKLAYYRIRIRNYVVFYVVIDDVMEVRRFLYYRQDASRHL